MPVRMRMPKARRQVRLWSSSDEESDEDQQTAVVSVGKGKRNPKTCYLGSTSSVSNVKSTSKSGGKASAKVVDRKNVKESNAKDRRATGRTSAKEAKKETTDEEKKFALFTISDTGEDSDTATEKEQESADSSEEEDSDEPAKEEKSRDKPTAESNKLATDELKYFHFEHMLVGEDPKWEICLYECYCGDDFPTRKAFKEHLEENKMPAEQIYECKICAQAAVASGTILGNHEIRLFVGKERFLDHLRKKHGQNV